MSPGRLLLGLGLLAAGIWVVALPGPAAQAPAVTRVAEPRAVNPSAGESLDLSANNSPSLARSPVDPRNVVLAHRVDLPQFACGLHVSGDGGRTWAETAIPQPPDTEPKCYAPDVAFDTAGTLFVSFVMLQGPGNVPDSVWTVSSRDGGVTLSEPSPVTGPLAFGVRMLAHPEVANRLVVTWLQARETGTLSFPDTHNPVVVATSEDGGRTWDGPLRVSQPGRARVLAPSPAFGQDGDLYVAHLDVLDDRLNYHGAHGGRGGPAYPGPWQLVLTRSTDGGRSWEESVVADDLVPIERYLVFLPPTPSLAVDGDRVVVAFHDARSGDPDVWLWSSPDAGASWEPPVRVNDTEPGDGTAQYLPAVSAGPNGRIDVAYYDRRTDPDDVENTVSFQYSVNGGRSFSPSVLASDVAFDSRIGFGAGRGMPDLGSRLALLSDADEALLAWADTRNGILESGKQDVFQTAVVFDTPAAAAPTSTRAGGAALGLAGLGVLAWMLRRARG